MSTDRTGLSKTPSESPLPPAILRSLGDRSYDKRKNAALEIEVLIRTLQENKSTDRICSVIAMLGQDFATSTNANNRKGGLIGLAASAIGLMLDANLYLDALLPPVLHCLDDPESRVRYYSCESLYNISKVARGHVLRYFNQIFDGLCKLFADVDIDVKNGANLLDRLIKDIVTESASFDVEKFIPLLQKYIRRSNPYIRQLLVGWIIVLDSVPDINMLDWLPDFLDGLFNMLSDSNRGIRQSADSAIAIFLEEIKKSPFVEFGPMVGILVNQCHSLVRLNRFTAIIWVKEFIKLGSQRLLLFYPELLGSVMDCISDDDLEIGQFAGQTHADLLDLVEKTRDDIELTPILQTLTAGLTCNHIPTRMAALQWISMLLDKVASKMAKFIPELLPSLLCTLSDEADEVLARISLLNDEEFMRVLDAILHLFFEDKTLLELRGSLIIRKLCVLLDAKSIYLSLATILQGTGEYCLENAEPILVSERLYFRSIVVQTLSCILLTARELDGLRLQLRSCLKSGASQEAIDVFVTLFGCWCHNPVSTLALCLIAQAYQLSSSLIDLFPDVNITVGFLVQVDKLVQLLESPVFLQLRLHLLDVHDTAQHPFLLKTMYGLLMLLPQSAAYATLNGRLATISTLQMHMHNLGSASPLKSSIPSAPDLQNQLLNTFRSTQSLHANCAHQTAS